MNTRVNITVGGDTTDRVYWDTLELIKMKAWIDARWPHDPPLVVAINSAQEACLPPDRRRAIVNRSLAQRAWERMIRASAPPDGSGTVSVSIVKHVAPTAPVEVPNTVVPKKTLADLGFCKWRDSEFYWEISREDFIEKFGIDVGVIGATLVIKS